ncbi:hypothetical protein CHGG_07400 [Chaetomium globosum CBS 148.51]|uniref:Oxidoreductase n=1 Tax=Chaetomium globosum (strain ATCC 6205 / CBS 148.51 / DSM 1962 / NBRC 6347 / NRRL 1970) TaxID=306901 RepID=Q2GXA4_CHAGB|nr:uncharacterized protein CHGG_07400 [Chaetomium globosum CBS 148.51]EAQ86147.1 hypothetical protein CHGG_07400 [Chaetomium globosum CBS 148.51]
MSSQKQFNVGIVGYGLSAKVFHIPFIALTPTLNLHSILQRTPTPTNSAPADHPTLKHVTTLDALLSDPALDIVILCTPPNTHFSFARAALDASKHVLVEKPFVPSAREADELAALARARGRVLCVYQNRRWDSDFLTVRRLLEEGVLGRVVLVSRRIFDRIEDSAPRRAGGWKAGMGMVEGGGVVFDLGTHLLDQVFVLFGMPSAVYGPFVRFWVRGSKGSYHKTGLDPQEGQLRGGGKATDAGFGRETEAEFGRLSVLGEDGVVVDRAYPTVEPDTYLKFYELFAKAVESGKEEDVPVPATQAAQVLRIIEALKESAKTGREVAP